MQRRKYTEEFKREAVKLAEESRTPKSQVARELGICENVLYRWIGQYGSKSQPREGLSSDERAELIRLRREMRRITQERDILKKAISIFSKEPSENTGL
jgi:transposase